MLVILTTHPIQYQVPLWQALAADGRVPFEVWYLTDHGVHVSRDKEFGQDFAWDLPLLEGYPHRFLKVNPDWVMDLAKPHGIRLAEPLGPLFRDRGVTHLLVTGWHKLGIGQAVRQARRAGVKIWLRAESNDLGPLPAWKRSIRRQIHRLLFSQVDEFLCIGMANRRLYEKAGLPAARLWPAPYCVDNARFARQAAGIRGQRTEIREQWGIPAGALCVLFCGKFIPKKRPLDLIAAAQLLLSPASGLRRPVHLLFVGSGELGEELRARCAVSFDAEVSPPDQAPGAAQAGSVPATFAGFLNQTEISRAYVAADLLVLPSDHGETWGLVVNEAMASGLPCAVSDAVGCGADLVAPLDPRLRFPLGDTVALAAALLEASLHPPAAGAISRHIAGFDLQVTAATIASLWAREPAGSLPRREIIL
jgi:glycosyltransferase involved in cell wall biosynthesis